MRALAAALAIWAPAAFASPEVFNVDPGHTFPAFEVVHLGISTQRGRFDRTGGRIELDREAGSGRIELAIESASVSTGNRALDGVLKGEDFFDVEGERMEMKRLNGTGVRSAGYDERNRKLVVETTAGTFEYANISPEIHRRLMTSPSPGTYYKESIEEEFTGRRIAAPASAKRPPPDIFGSGTS